LFYKGERTGWEIIFKSGSFDSPSARLRGRSRFAKADPLAALAQDFGRRLRLKPAPILPRDFRRRL
jgi:hypothetical protein